MPGWEDSVDANYESRTTFRAGLLFDIPFSSRFSFQPALMFANKGREYTGPGNGSHTGVSRTQILNYLDVPLNLVVKFPLGDNSNFIIGAGPYVGLLLSANEKLADGTRIEDVERGDGPGQYKGFDVGWNALAGAEFGRFFITANYSAGLNDFYQPVNYEANYRNRTIGGTIGFFLNSGKPRVRDADNDGIIDAEDECPNEPGTAVTKGCPDRDGDGIADKNDNCPDQAGTTKYNGCPIPDTDKDGINDELDKCPNEAGTAKYEGCPVPDTDKDGVNDELDRCPNEAGPASNNGCPVPVADADRDGIPDTEDNCPNLAGTRENNGCPELSSKLSERTTSSGRRISFTNTTGSTLSANDKKALADVVAVLNENPDLKLTVNAHTAAGGNEESNVTLTQNRADAVKTYLVSQGISADRITTQGLGSSQPISSGTTATEKAKNRRVELTLSYN
jgi:outer membrane protein OmpA-like peptidoglycan-associated protein